MRQSWKIDMWCLKVLEKSFNLLFITVGTLYKWYDNFVKPHKIHRIITCSVVHTFTIVTDGLVCFSIQALSMKTVQSIQPPVCCNCSYQLTCRSIWSRKAQVLRRKAYVFSYMLWHWQTTYSWEHSLRIMPVSTVMSFIQLHHWWRQSCQFPHRIFESPEYSCDLWQFLCFVYTDGANVQSRNLCNCDCAGKSERPSCYCKVPSNFAT